MSNKKKALITGSTSGLGLAYARYFAKEGYDLLITGRRKEKLYKQAESIRKEFNVHVNVKIVELGTKEGLDSLIETIKETEKNSYIDVLVNNAGYGLKPYFYDLTRDEIDRMIYVHTNVVSTLCNFVLKGMVERNSGTIINISSSGAFAVLPRNVLYSSTKMFIVNLTEGISMETHGTNIKVQVVCPGMIDTDFHTSADMKVNKNAKGLLSFSSPESVVQASIRDLKKGKTICLPSRSSKIVRFITKVLPYKMCHNLCLKISGNAKRKRTISKQLAE